MMPVAKVQLEDGRIARFEVPEGTTPQQVEQFVSENRQQFDNQKTAKESVSQIPTGIAGVTENKFSQADKPTQPSMMDRIKGAGEAALTLGTGVTTGTLGYLGGAAKGIAEEFATGRFGEGIAEREAAEGSQALTYMPKTETGQEYVKDVGEAAAPLAALGPIMQDISAATRTISMPKYVKPHISKKLMTPRAKKLLKDAAPTTTGLKQAARDIYNELDNIGVAINPRRVNRLSGELKSIAKKQGFHKRIHPKVSAVLDEFTDAEGNKLTLGEIDTLRKIARAAASSNEADEARLGTLIIGKIDDTLDSLTQKDFIGGQAKKAGAVGAKYRDARQLWQRAKKSEMIQDAFERAQNQASGFENGLRTQFRSILNNKKKIKGFTPEELNAMRTVVRGGSMENIAKAIGKFGFTEGQASGMLLGSLGVAGGASVGGAPGAVAVPLIGQVSKSLAQKLTRNNAEFANALVRAGKNAKSIVNAYIKSTKRSERNPAELAELLVKNNVNISSAKRMAATMPKESRRALIDAAFIAGVMQSQRNEGQEQEENRNVMQ